jgi:hypothetical protein
MAVLIDAAVSMLPRIMFVEIALFAAESAWLSNAEGGGSTVWLFQRWEVAANHRWLCAM